MFRPVFIRSLGPGPAVEPSIGRASKSKHAKAVSRPLYGGATQDLVKERKYITGKGPLLRPVTQGPNPQEQCPAREITPKQAQITTTEEWRRKKRKRRGKKRRRGREEFEKERCPSVDRTEKERSTTP